MGHRNVISISSADLATPKGLRDDRWLFGGGGFFWFLFFFLVESARGQ